MGEIPTTVGLCRRSALHTTRNRHARVLVSAPGDRLHIFFIARHYLFNTIASSKLCRSGRSSALPSHHFADQPPLPSVLCIAVGAGTERCGIVVGRAVGASECGTLRRWLQMVDRCAQHKLLRHAE